MSQSGQESPGEQHGDKDIGHTDDKDHVVNDRRHAQREAMSSKEEKQVIFDVMKAVMKWRGDGEKRMEWKMWECIWYRNAQRSALFVSSHVLGCCFSWNLNFCRVRQQRGYFRVLAYIFEVACYCRLCVHACSKIVLSNTKKEPQGDSSFA